MRAVAAIYAHHVRTGAATFEIEPPGSTEMDRRRQEIQTQGLPNLVAETDGIIAGYAYAGHYRARPAYRFTLEDSVYVHPDFVSRGYGQQLLSGLIEICIAKHSRLMIAVIGERANAPSIRLHARCGFREIGVLEGVGRKFGRWIDTVIMQRTLYSDERLDQIREIVKCNANAAATLQQVVDLLRQGRRYRWVGLYKVDHKTREVQNLVFSGVASYPSMPMARLSARLMLRAKT